MISTNELREMYLEYFAGQGHSRQPSDVLVPTWDPSVLFTPAGMNQFKDHFLGKVELEYTRATTCQKCLRTGDIDNVGRTAYHHTFFEMLGNFSFGDYFKEDAIRWAWEFLTDKNWLAIPAERLTVTVYKDDDEAAGIWNEKIGLPFERISRMDEDENFWPASAPSEGPDGVCGPCSEIYYKLDSGKEVEIWNLVFTQFNRLGPPPNNLHPLPSKNIDTGMGLERTASVLQNQPTNFHIDVLYPIVQAASEICKTRYEYESENGRRLRRITDHVRACTFAIHENVYPGPKKAPYVIKRLARRAVLDGHQMGMREPFLYELVPHVVASMKAAYPELADTVDRVAQGLRNEETEFFKTIDAGLRRTDELLADAQHGNTAAQGMVDGQEAARLYQTYGFPPELLSTLANEQGLGVDWEGYRAEMLRHEQVSGSDQKELFKTGPLETLKETIRKSEFLGYELEHCVSRVVGILAGASDKDRIVDEISADESDAECIRIVLDRSPFYAESGGQIGDTGTLSSDDVEVSVYDTQKAGDLIVHFGKLQRGSLRSDMEVTATVDGERRKAIRRAHSATHILHHALQTHVGSQAQQQGSKVEDDALRFDFSSQTAVDDTTLSTVESTVKQWIQSASPVTASTVTLADARKAGAMMLFGEKYPDPVRMVSMGEFSKELCGGTHVSKTDDIQAFEILSEESVSAGTRRVSALTGKKASEFRESLVESVAKASQALSVKPHELGNAVAMLILEIKRIKKALASGETMDGTSQKVEAVVPDGDAYLESRKQIRLAARALNVKIGEVPARIQAMVTERRELLEKMKEFAASSDISATDMMSESELISGVRCLAKATNGATPVMMKRWVDEIRREATEPTAVLLASDVGDGKVVLVCGMTSDLVSRKFSAGNWVREVAQVVDGSGGGKADLAQAGGKSPAKIGEALEKAKSLCHEMFAKFASEH